MSDKKDIGGLGSVFRKKSTIIFLILWGSCFLFVVCRSIYWSYMDSKHVFQYEVGEKVKVRDAVGFVIRRELHLNMFSISQTNTENYVIAIENTETEIYVDNSVMNKYESKSPN